jgi:hypothetical protein
MQGDLHPAFGSWFNVPRDGYELRPRIYWCWDEASAAAVERWAARTDRAFAVVGGDPWRDAWRSDGAPLVSPSDAEVAAAKAATGGSVHVLVSLDSTGAVIPPVILEAARRAPRSWCFWFRLHPLTVRTRLESTRRLVRATGATAADVAYASELPLFAILRQVDVHVTATWSTVVRDAAALGVPSVGCTPEARELFATEVAHGALRVASSPDELLAAIEEQRHRRLPTERAAPRSRGAMQRVLAGEPARAAEPVAS